MVGLVARKCGFHYELLCQEGCVKLPFNLISTLRSMEHVQSLHYSSAQIHQNQPPIRKHLGGDALESRLERAKKGGWVTPTTSCHILRVEVE